MQKEIGERTGAVVRWNSQGPADSEVEAKLEGMLAGELTVDQAVQVALLRNRNVQAGFEELGIAQADLVQAGLLRNPVFEAQVRWPDAGAGGTNIELAVVQNFIDLVQLPLRKRVAEAEFEKAKLDVTQALLKLAAEVKGAYYQVQAAEQGLALRQRAMETLDLAAELAQRARRAGNINELELANQEAMREQAWVDWNHAKSETEEARERLTALMGLEATRWTVRGQIEAVPQRDAVGNLEPLALERRLDLAAARQETIAVSKAAGVWPLGDVEVGVDGEHETDGRWVTGPRIAVPIPLFDTGEATLSRARARARQAAERYAAMRVEARSEVRMLQGRMLAARQRVERYDRVILPLRQRIVEQTQLHYNGMLTGPYQLLQAKQAQFDAQRERLEALRDYWVARSELERSVGGKLPAGQAMPAATMPATQPASQPAMPHHHHHEE